MVKYATAALTGLLLLATGLVEGAAEKICRARTKTESSSESTVSWSEYCIHASQSDMILQLLTLLMAGCENQVLQAKRQALMVWPFRRLRAWARPPPQLL